MNIYFKLPHIGDLMLEHEFYSLGNDPILFVCKDKVGRRYLCSCCHIGDEWVVGQASEEKLLDLIDDSVSIREVFETCNSLYFVIWNGESFCSNSELPDNALPQTGAFLELEEEKTGAFRETLERDAKQRKTEKAMMIAYQTVLPYIQQAAPYMKCVLQALLSTAPMLHEISKYLSVIDTAQIQKISETVTQHIVLSQPSQFDNFSIESESVMIPVAKDGVVYEKACENDEIYRYAA